MEYSIEGLEGSPARRWMHSPAFPRLGDILRVHASEVDKEYRLYRVESIEHHCYLSDDLRPLIHGYAVVAKVSPLDIVHSEGHE